MRNSCRKDYLLFNLLKRVRRNFLKKAVRAVCIAMFALPLLNAAGDHFQKNPSAKFSALLLGTKAPYRFAAEGNTPPPYGYKPVFINYVGRHGARFLTDPEDLISVMKILSAAKKMHCLTRSGYRLERMLYIFGKIEKGNYGNITRAGAEEQEGIGLRMYRHYAGVFKGNGLNVVMTSKVRTQQSARAFLKSLSSYPSYKIHERIIPDSSDDILRYYDLSSAYRSYKKGPTVKSRIDSLLADRRMKKALSDLNAEFFRNSFMKKMQAGGIAIAGKNGKRIYYDIKDFTDNLFGIYTIEYSMRYEIRKSGRSLDNTDFGSFFNSEDLQWLAFTDGAGEFMEKGPACDTLGIQIRDAVPLLVDFIRTADDYINFPNSIDADLRFAHAETVSPFATLLGIRAASSPSPSIFRYGRHWQPSKIIPLSSNIQWILYSKNGHYLLKVLLNEREAKLPINTSTFPYYDWEEVKNYYLKKLALMHTGLDKNMHEYLVKLR